MYITRNFYQKWSVLFSVLLLLSCYHQQEIVVSENLRKSFTVDDAEKCYNACYPYGATRLNVDERLPFLIGNARLNWHDAKESSCLDRSAVDVPLEGGNFYKVYRKQLTGVFVEVDTSLKVVAVRDDKIGKVSFYIKVIICSTTDDVVDDIAPNFEERNNFNGLEYYLTIDGSPVAIVNYENGNVIESVFLGNEDIVNQERLNALKRLLGGLCIARCCENTRTENTMDYGKIGSIIVDQFGMMYICVDTNNDNRADAVLPIFREDIYVSVNNNTGGGNTSGNSLDSGSLGIYAGSSGLGSSGLGSNGGESNVGVGANVGGAGSNIGAGLAGGNSETNIDSSSIDNDNLANSNTKIEVWDPNISSFVDPTLSVSNVITQKYEKIKKNINLGDSSKFVGYNTDGECNCLKLCEAILSNYGITNYGSPLNVFKLMHEEGGALMHYGENIAQNYNKAIDCIDRHLEAGRPIIVGVNHTLNYGINDGATDHFVVIYGREYDIELKCYCYLYYEVGSRYITIGCDDASNRFMYDTSEPPYLYDVESRCKHRQRLDVVQVRPNDGNTSGTIPQNSK